MMIKYKLDGKINRTIKILIILCLSFVLLLSGCDVHVDVPTPTQEPILDVKDNPYSEGKTYLAYEGKSAYSIVISENALDAVKTASTELQKYLEQITGFKSPIVKDNENEWDFEVILGHTNRDTEEVDKSREGLGSEGYIIKWVGRKLYITGGDEGSTYGRGTLYGVYDFLRTLGCGFYSVDTEVVPKMDTVELDITGEEIKEVPAFEYRDLFWTNTYDEVLSAKLHINGCLMSGTDGRIISKEYGSGVYYAGAKFVHTFTFLIPADEYFSSHPEYFSLINGKRTGEQYKSQLCLTNEDVYTIIRDKVRDWLLANPEAKIVSISQNDGAIFDSYCACKNCAAIDKAEGSHAGTLIRFINRLAEELEPEFPDVAFDTLAYQYSVTPTKTSPRDNVIIRYCTGACTRHAINDSSCTTNDGVETDIKKWNKKCNRIYVWNYTTNYADYLCPMMNFDAIAEDIKFFKENGVAGIFEQGMYQEGTSGELGELRCYIMARLMWDPYEDVEKIKEEFMNAYYGEAAKNIQEYIEILDGRLKKARSHLGVSAQITSIYGGKILNNTLWEQMETLFSDAKEKVKNNPLILEHVERTELSYRELKRSFNKFEFEDTSNNKAVIQFYKDCIRLGVKRLNEGAMVPGA